ncbi:hypothetical protein M3Y99_01310600 [Aphelenchoides fujianensis]|nr:hypothetical protein M3Y99_01310600 [Aphelenchoides fujianensis]
MPPPAVRPLLPRSALVIDHRPPTFGGEHFLPSGTRLPAHSRHWWYTVVSKLKGGSFGVAMKLRNAHLVECVGKIVVRCKGEKEKEERESALRHEAGILLKLTRRGCTRAAHFLDFVRINGNEHEGMLVMEALGQDLSAVAKKGGGSRLSGQSMCTLVEEPFRLRDAVDIDWTQEHAVRFFSGRASPFLSARAAHCCEQLAPLDDLERLFHVLFPLFGHSPVVSIAEFSTTCEDDGEERMFAAKRAFWSEKPSDLPPPLADLWPLIADSRRSQWPPYSKAEKLVHSHRRFLASVEGEEPLADFPHFLC